MTNRITFEDGSCYKNTLEAEPLDTPCIPDDALFLGSQTIGSGDRAIRTNAFEVSSAAGNRTMVAEEGTCTPISMTRTGRLYGEDQQRTTMFYDVQPFIDAGDRALLATPPNCETPLPTATPAAVTQGPLVG